MTEEDPRNKRGAPRVEVLGPALILAPDVRADCVIRDLSSTGARIAISWRIKLPQQFDVLLLKTNSTRRCIMRWRRGDFVGVEFVRGETAPLQPTKESAGVKSSWRGRRERDAV